MLEPRQSPGDKQLESNAKSTPEDGHDLKRKRSKTTEKSTKRGPPTWLSPFGVAWRRSCGERVPWGQLARYLARLCRKFGVPAVAAAFGRYLDETDPRYVSPARFAATTVQWGLGNGARPKGPHYPTADEADRAAGIPLSHETPSD